MNTIRMNETENRFILEKEGKKAFIDFRLKSKELVILHTEVPEELEGKGLASQLAQFAFQYAEENELQVRVYCSFVKHYLETHPQYKKIVI